MKLTAIVPVFNERATVLEVVRRLRAVELPTDLEVVLVDDGSTDGTVEVLRGLVPGAGLVVHLSEKNGGKGAAVRKGIELATGDWIIIQDADLELDPDEIARLLAVALAGRASIVYGSRFLGKPPVRSSINWWANRLLTALTNLLYGTTLTDMETCYKLFPGSFLKGLVLEASRFEIEPELTAKAVRLGHAIHEVPIAYSPRTVLEGKKMRWKDGFAAVAMLVRVRVAPQASLRR